MMFFKSGVGGSIEAPEIRSLNQKVLPHPFFPFFFFLLFPLTFAFDSTLLLLSSQVEYRILAILLHPSV